MCIVWSQAKETRRDASKVYGLLLTQQQIKSDWHGVAEGDCCVVGRKGETRRRDCGMKIIKLGEGEALVLTGWWPGVSRLGQALRRCKIQDSVHSRYRLHWLDWLLIYLLF